MPRLPRLRSWLIGCFLGVVAWTQVVAVPREEVDRLFDFELPAEDGGIPGGGWQVGKAGGVSLDSEVVHRGKQSVRLERADEAPGKFSWMSVTLPRDFEGQTIELRGFLRVEEVVGFAGLMLRLDNDSGMVAMDNMSSRQLHGTRDWEQHAITLRLVPGVQSVYLGVLLAGTGRLWADDLELLVDGQPIAAAPKFEPPKTPLDLDHEFDAGSGIALAALTDTQIENLTMLGRVWGLLKYHHPRVRKGELHWDYELFRVMPQMLVAMDRAAANAVLLDWLDQLEVDARPADAAAVLDEHDLALRPDLEWLHDEARLGSDLSERLVELQARRGRSTPQFYVSQVRNVRNPVFEHEPAYPAVAFPDAGYQLLGLFRFWNIITWWSPYRDLVGGDWQAVLAEFVPLVAKAATKLEYEQVMLRLCARVNDTHTNLWSSLDAAPPVGEAGLPVQVRFIEEQATITGLAADAPDIDLQVGDVIEAIDGQLVTELVAKWSPYHAASNEPTRLRNIARVFTRGPAGPVVLRVRREGVPETVEVSLRREERFRSTSSRNDHERDGPAFQLLSPAVAYLRLSAMKAKEATAYIEQAASTRGLVIDARSYPSEFQVFAFGQHLVAKPTDFACFSSGDLATPGAFHFGDAMTLKPGKPRYRGRIVMLVDEITQSSAEYTTMAFRSAPGAKVIGSTTAGADGNASWFLLPGGLRTMISGIGVFYPDRKPTQRIGIVPDIKVEPTLAGIRAGRDEVLEAALREILGPDVSDAEIEQWATQPRG